MKYYSSSWSDPGRPQRFRDTPTLATLPHSNLFPTPQHSRKVKLVVTGPADPSTMTADLNLSFGRAISLLEKKKKIQ